MTARTASWICCLLAGSLLLHCECIKWLGLFRYTRPPGYSSGSFTSSECQRASAEFGFKKRQLKFCKNENFSFAMSAILYAAKAAVYHCSETFADRRWNCSSTRALPSVTPDLKRGTREQSFVYAFASAALVYSIARACAKQEILNCPCGVVPRENVVSNATHRWDGCHDNLQIAVHFASQFLGLRKRKKTKRRDHMNRYPFQRFKRSPIPDPLAAPRRRRRRRGRGRKKSALNMMNRHNYRAGIRIMNHRRSVNCKCNGVSGSCSLKICFYQVTRLSDQRLSAFLRDNYVKAVWVKKDGNRLVPAMNFRRNGVPSGVLPTEMVFIKHSPDYCLPDAEVGSTGTQGRRCNSTMGGSFKCENMCCGRGYVTETFYYEDAKCNCKLRNYVIICVPCQKRMTRHICK